MKKKKQEKSLLHSVYEPYKQFPSDTVEDYYKRWLEDESAVCEIKGNCYYKALSVTKMNFGSRKGLLVLLSTELNLKIGSVLVDEIGNEYIVSSFEMINFKIEIPD